MGRSQNTSTTFWPQLPEVVDGFRMTLRLHKYVEKESVNPPYTCKKNQSESQGARIKIIHCNVLDALDCVFERIVDLRVRASRMGEIYKHRVHIQSRSWSIASTIAWHF